MAIDAIKPQPRGSLKPAPPQDFLTLKLEASNLTTIWAECSRIEKMITQNYSYRYYYYYGLLSRWRDGRVMGCRELIN